MSDGIKINVRRYPVRVLSINYSEKHSYASSTSKSPSCGMIEVIRIYTILAVSNVLVCAGLIPLLGGVYEKSSSSAPATSVAESCHTTSVRAGTTFVMTIWRDWT